MPTNIQVGPKKPKIGQKAQQKIQKFQETVFRIFVGAPERNYQTDKVPRRPDGGHPPTNAGRPAAQRKVSPLYACGRPLVLAKVGEANYRAAKFWGPCVEFRGP